MDPTNRINDLIVISKRLVDVLEREKEALNNRNYFEINEILDEKVTLGRVYESRIMGLSDEETDLNQVDRELRDQLQDIGNKVNTLIESNSTLLKIGIEANRRVVNMIAEAVKASVPNAGTYAANGSNAVAEQVTKKNVAISIDHTL